jgi:hypothetical protein
LKAALALLSVLVLILGGGLFFEATASTSSIALAPGTTTTAVCPNSLTTSNKTAHSITLKCAANKTPPPTTTTVAPPTTTTVPVTTTTTPPSTTTSTPVNGNWPTAADTGSSGTLTDVTPPTGELILDQTNQVFANTRVHGTVTVLGCNITLRNVEVDASEPYNGNASPDLFAVWLKEDPSCSVTLDHVSVLTPAGQYATEAVRDAYGGPATVTSLNAQGQQLGMTVGVGTVVTDSYIALAPTLRGDHNEDVLDDGTTSLTLTHNTFLNPNGQTSALSLFTEFGPNSDVLVKDNWLAGGGYTCYCGDGATSNSGAPAPSSNVSFEDNVFSEQYFPTVGAFGPGRAYNPAGGGQWLNNVYALPDGTVTTQQVSQPPLDGK